MSEPSSNDFPFAFFGAEPADWFALAGDLFSYELRFTSAPDPAARRAIAEAWERALDPRAVEIVAPFLWADRWALVRVRPAGWSKPCIADMARAVQRALRAAHAAHPIEVVSLAEVLESDSDWDAWSADHLPEPPMGPRWPVELPRSGAGERFEAACAEDPAVEAARAAVRSEAAAEGRAWASEAGGGDDDEARDGDDDDEAKVLEGGIRLERVRGFKLPEIARDQKKLFGSGEAFIAPSGRIYGVARPRRQAPVPAWIEEGELRTAAGDPLPRSHYGLYMAERGDGGAALIGMDEEAAWEVVFAEGTVRRLFEHEASLSDVAYGPEGRVLLLCGSTLDVYRREGDGAALEQRWDVNGYGMCSLRDGRLILVKCFEDDGGDGVTLLGMDGATLRRLGRVRAAVNELLVEGSRVILEHGGSRGSEHHELVGLDELLERFAAQPGAFPELKVATDEEDDAGDTEDDDDGSEDEEDKDAGSRPEVLDGALRLERRKRREMPEEPQPGREARERFGSRCEVRVAPGGRVYGLGQQRRKPAFAGWIESGELRVAEGGPMPGPDGQLAAREDGGAALLGFDHDSVWELDFASGRVRRLFEHEESLYNVAYGPEGRIVLASSGTIDVYRREGDGAVLEQRWDVDSYGACTGFGGRLFLAKSYEGEDSDDGVWVLGFDGPRLRRLGRVRASVGEMLILDDRVFVEHSGDWYELLGVPELLATLAANPEAFPEVAVASPSDQDDEGGEDDDDEYDDDGDEDEDEAPVRKRRPEDFAVEPAPGRVGLRYLGQERPLPEWDDDVPKPIRSLFGTGAKEIARSGWDDTYTGWKKLSRREVRFAVVRQGELVETELTARDASSMTVVSRDRSLALVPTDGDSKLWRIELPRGKPHLVWDFSKEEDENEIYVVDALAHDRVIVGTMNEAWLFSLQGGSPALELRGALDLRQVETTCGGRAAVLELSGNEPLRVWGIYEDGPRVLAAFDLEPLDIAVDAAGTVFVEAAEGLGWYELVNIEDAWEAARRDAAGDQYPRVVLSPKSAEEEEDEEDDEDDGYGDGEDEDGDEDEDDD